MGKGYNNYMCKKPFHPGSKANIKRAWMAEQKTENEKRKQEELKVQYEKEQDLYNNRAMISSESKDKLELNFMYEAPPGAKRERQKEDDEPEFKFEWQRKYNAPREDYAKGNEDIKDQPFGIPVRNVRCIKCHKWGHINTDKECPLYNQASTSSMPTTSMDPLELMRQMKEDGFGLKEHVLGHQLNPAAANQQFIPSDESDPEMDFLKSLSTAEKKKLLKKLKKLSKKQERSANCKKKKSKKSKKSKAKNDSSSEADEDKRVKKKKKSKKSSSSSESDSSSSDESSKMKNRKKNKCSEQKGKSSLNENPSRAKGTNFDHQSVKEKSVKNAETKEKINKRDKDKHHSSHHKYKGENKDEIHIKQEKHEIAETKFPNESSKETKKEEKFCYSSSNSDEEDQQLQKVKLKTTQCESFKSSKHLETIKKEKKSDYSGSSSEAEQYEEQLQKEKSKHSEYEPSNIRYSRNECDDKLSMQKKTKYTTNSSDEDGKRQSQKMKSERTEHNVKEGTNKRKAERNELEESCDGTESKKVKSSHPDGFSHLCPQALVETNYLKPEEEYKGDTDDRFRHLNRDKRSPSVKQKYNH